MLYLIMKRIIFFVICNIIIGLGLVQFASMPTINSTEHGPLELTQLFILSICFVLSSAVLHYFYKTDFTSIDAIMGLGLWLLSTAILGRETSWGSEYGVVDSASDLIELIAIIILTLVSLMTLKFLLQKKHKLQFVKQILFLPIVPVLLGAAGFVLTGKVFEKEYIALNYNQFMEESYECIGYMLFLWAHIIQAKTIIPRVFKLHHHQ